MRLINLYLNLELIYPVEKEYIKKIKISHYLSY